MRTLMVSPYPPVRDGIAAYALQSVAALRADGEDVEVLSPGPSAAHHHLDLVGPRGALALARRLRAYDRVVIQFHPDFFYRVGARQRERAVESLALAAAFFMARRLEVVVHEIDYRRGRGTSPAALAARLLWRLPDRIEVHSQRECEEFVHAFAVPRRKLNVIEHGGDFVARVSDDRVAARERLGVPQDEFVFLSIGFIQPHKGYDRAIRAFAGLPAPAALYVVGSVRVEEQEYVQHVDEILEAARATRGVDVRVQYVSDEDFDRWIVAADVVVLPYRGIWSSGVIERARLFDRAVIATRVGALAEQVAGLSNVRLVEDDDELREAMWQAANGSVDRHREVQPWPGAGAGRDAIQAEVIARADAERGVRVTADAQAVRGRATTTAPLRRLRPLGLPDPGPRRGLRSLARRAVRRVSAWQLQPIVDQVNALRTASLEAVERVAALDDARGDDSRPTAH